MAQQETAFVLSKCEIVTWVERPAIIQSHWIRTQVGDLLFEFKIEASQRVESLPQLVLPADSLPNVAGTKLSEHGGVYLFLHDDKGYIRYRSSYYDVFRFNEDGGIFVQGPYGWEQDGDYGLTISATRSHKSVKNTIPTTVELVALSKQANEFTFKVDLGTSTGPRLVRYRKGYGRVFVRYPADDIEYELTQVEAVCP
ncbi:MAG: hypothetical protein JST45_12935 [Bacteroidetes bacterium]|nr:hypothetical protein [Bacteroidota bacterium]